MEMQMQQEDLSSLFSRNLSLYNNAYTEPLSHAVIHQTTKPEDAITYSITRHYHHSAHLAPKPSRPASDPVTDQKTTEIILSRHGVDITTLFPSQIELFQTADPSQQMRLVELWRISPSSCGGHAIAGDFSAWHANGFDQDGTVARLRHEQKVPEERKLDVLCAADQEHFDNGELRDASMTPIQSGDGSWSMSTNMEHSPEPYMASGYDMLAQREYELSAQQPSRDVYSHFGTTVGGPSYNKSTDPVYRGIDTRRHQFNCEDWVCRSQEQHQHQQQEQAMENQYGAFASIRQHGSGIINGEYGTEDHEML